MSEMTQEFQLQNGFELQSESQPEPESKVESQPEPETKPEEELKLELVVTDADPKREEDKESSIQLNEAAKPASTDQIARLELRKDEGNRTFTMTELLSELKSDEDDARSPYRFFFFLFPLWIFN